MKSAMKEKPQNRVEAMKAWIEKNPLRIWRNAQDISMRMAATLMDVNLHTIQSWEQGNAWPSDDNMAKIAATTNEPNMANLWMQWNAQKPV